MTWWGRIRRRTTQVGARTAGPPRSANGASSFHLSWQVGGEFAAVSVILEVLEPPAVDRLYFWALQADFASASGRAGGAHLGLQWHPSHPGARAVNWGGYDASGSELHGSDSALSSALHNPNTRDLAWSERTPYRLTIRRAPDADQPPADVATAWRGTVTDLRTGAEVVVRDLYVCGDRIVGVVMWSEVFADCDAPPASVRWSDAAATALDGTGVHPSGFVVNYQSHADGGCANSDSFPDATGIVQRSAVPRTTPQRTILRTADPGPTRG